MPHERNRYLAPLILRALKHSPIVGVFGQRQTGKTTLIHGLAKEYATFDQIGALSASENDPEGFITRRRAPFAIDECQLSPRIFPALKEHVRVHPAMGQFLLTGSVRFSSRRAIRESLTGRIYLLELLPFSISELHQIPLGDSLVRALKGRLEKKLRLKKSSLQPFLLAGGLPGIGFTRDAHIRANKFESHLDTLLERDLRLIYNTRLGYPTLRHLLVVLALNQGQPLDFAETARKTRLNPRTLRELLRGFESIFLIRNYPTEGGQRRPVFFLEDQGMATHLAGSPLSPLDNLIRGIYSNARHQFHYRPELNARIFQYRTRGGALVPLAFHTRNGSLGIIPCIEGSATASAVKSAQSFVGKIRNSRVLILHSGENFSHVSDRIQAAPFEVAF